MLPLCWREHPDGQGHPPAVGSRQGALSEENEDASTELDEDTKRFLQLFPEEEERRTAHRSVDWGLLPGYRLVGPENGPSGQKVPG